MQQNQMLQAEIKRLKEELRVSGATIYQQRRTISEQAKNIRELNKKTIRLLEKDKIVLNKDKVTFMQAFGMKCTEKSILTYLEQFLATQPTWDNLNTDNLQRFSMWLRKSAKNKRGELFNDSTVCTYIARLKVVIKYGYQNSNDASTAIKSARPAKKKKIWLRPSDLRKLVEYVPLSDEEAKVKQTALICAITGCRVSDTLEIKQGNIDGNTLHYTPIKTKNQQCYVKLSDEAVGFLKSLISDSPEQDYSDSNVVLKTIFRNLGMTNKVEIGTPNKPELVEFCDAIHFHSFRHSFATIRYRYSDWTEREIADAMGHSSFNQTFESYICDKSTVTTSEKEANQDSLFV
ncbi:tyrosine-type recombinase/integrase [uncultured Dysgonomonas sp.]|nr:tyrosine-type recombinase/integrase [uncultured Dysgonomonas sp.]